MRTIAFVVATIGALAVTAPAVAASSSSAAGVAVQTRQAQPAQEQATEFSSHRRRYWHRHRSWHRPHYRPYRYYGRPYGWHRCRTVWRPHRGWVRICRW